MYDGVHYRWLYPQSYDQQGKKRKAENRTSEVPGDIPLLDLPQIPFPEHPTARFFIQKEEEEWHSAEENSANL